jgi:hypothetical protein
MRLCFSLALALAICGSLIAEDFWKAKEPANWSVKEIEKLLTDSPWAQETRVVFNGQGRPAMSLTDRSAMPSGGGSDSGTARGPGEISAAPSDSPGLRIIVRWESAAPVQEACAQGGVDTPFFACASKLLYLSGLGDKYAQLRKHFYIVSMSNFPRQTLLAEGIQPPQHSASANEALEKLGKRLQKVSVLLRDDKPFIAADHVVVLPVARALLVLIFFPRSTSMSQIDERLSFASRAGAYELKSTFRVQKMLYKGNLEL